MSAPFNVLAGAALEAAPSARVRALSTVAAVAVIHAALIVLLMRATERATPPYAIQSPVIRAQLLSPAPAPAAPSAPRSTPMPAAAPPPIVKKHAEPRTRPPAPAPAPPRTVVPAAPAQPAAPAPSAVAPNKQESAAAVAAPDTTDLASHPVQTAPAAAGRDTLAMSAPKDVRHVDCNIIKPDYPALSRRRGEAGTAYVNFVIGVSGAIENVELSKSSGYPRLDDAALAAMHASSCRPYTENGAPVRVSYTKPFIFAFGD